MRTRHSVFRFGLRSTLLTLAVAVVLPVAASAQDAASEKSELLSAFTEGKVTLMLRPRYEYATQDKLDHSNAITMRTALGYGTKPYMGLSLYGEFENVLSPNSGDYYDGIKKQNDQTIIADPSSTQLNQGYLEAKYEDYWGVYVKGPRQQIVYDDARFIGNVSWRQNWQTYDALRAGTTFGRDDLTFDYVYVWQANRIWGDRPRFGAAKATRDFKMTSHILHATWTAAEWAKIIGFAMFYDFNDPAAANSTTTAGIRATGKIPIGEDFVAAYQLSYAYQTQAKDNPASFEVGYSLIDGKFIVKALGAVGVGYEVLGSDGNTNAGARVFVTPLATAHKFNGWADAFLTNGGNRGLRDLYFYLAPKLPWKLKSKIVYHNFRSDKGGNDLGYEIDAQLSRPIGEYVTVLAKVAYYNEGVRSSPQSRTRFWLMTTFKF